MLDEPPVERGPAGVYIHFPFCAARCTYCDFTTLAGADHLVPRYLDALEREIAELQRGLPESADTIYFGGGTPSRMRPEQLRNLIEAVGRRFDLQAAAEVTLECNPENVRPEALGAFRAAGVTRFSIGVQSLDDAVLRRVARRHDGSAALRAVEQARRVDRCEVSVDLIAGLPGAKPERWQETLRTIAELEPDHISVYLLETDKQAPLARAIRSGAQSAPAEESLTRAYTAAIETLEEHGFGLYEISNFARRGRVSRHNLKYWSDLPYAGFGLGAHAYSRGRRSSNLASIEAYLSAVEKGRDPVHEVDPWDPGRRLDEALVLGLRLVEGVDLEALGQRYGADMLERYHVAWERGDAAGLLTWKGPRVSLTPRGRLLSNELFVDLLGASADAQ